MLFKAILVIIIFAIIGITEIPPLVKENNKKKIILYLIFYVLAFVLLFLYAIEVEFPELSTIINSIIEFFI